MDSMILDNWISITKFHEDAPGNVKFTPQCWETLVFALELSKM